MNATTQIPLTPAEEAEYKRLFDLRTELDALIIAAKINLRKLEKQHEDASKQWVALAMRKFGK